MARGHVVKVGNDWTDGFSVGRAAALQEWALRKELDDPEFEELCRRLRWRRDAKRYWRSLTPEKRAAIKEYRRQWRLDNRERYNRTVRDAKRRGRKTGAKWYKRALAKKRERFAEKTRKRREEVHTCVECGAQWCIGLGRIPSRPPKYCSQPCRARANHQRGKAAGKPWAQRGTGRPGARP